MWKKYKTIIIIGGILVLAVIGGIIQESIANDAPPPGNAPAVSGWQQVLEINKADNGSDTIGCLTHPFVITDQAWKIDWTLGNSASPSSFLPDGLTAELDLIQVDPTTNQSKQIAMLTTTPVPTIAYGGSESDTYSGSGGGTYELRVDSAYCQNGSIGLTAGIFQK